MKQAGSSQRRKGANSSPETAFLTKLQSGFWLLTKTSWDSGWLTSTGRVTARDQLPRRHTSHQRMHNRCHPANGAAGARELIRRTRHLGRVCSPSTRSPELLGLGRAQNAGPTEPVPLRSTRESEPERLRPGKCMQPRACFKQLTCRATWSPSSVDWESTHAVLG